jgi:hypothetical protein
METQKILLIGPAGDDRAQLQQRLDRLGGDVMTAEPEQTPLPDYGDVLYADARDESADWTALTEVLAEDNRPLVIVADAPRPIMRALSGRPGGVLVLTGSENDGGYRVAMNLCAALAGRRRPDRPSDGNRQRVSRPAWAPASAKPVAAV